MAECRYFPECQRCNETGDSWLPCDGGADGTRCEGYEPMPDVEALLRIAQVLESADKSECEGCILEDSGCHLCAVGVEHEIARRIRQAIGR